MVSFQVTLTLSDLQVPKCIPGICKFVDLFILGLGEAIDFKVEWPWMFIQLFNLFWGNSTQCDIGPKLEYITKQMGNCMLHIILTM